MCLARCLSPQVRDWAAERSGVRMGEDPPRIRTIRSGPKAYLGMAHEDLMRIETPGRLDYLD